MSWGLERATAIGAKRVRTVIERLFVRALADAPRGVRVERSDDAVTLSGRKLRERSLSDERLRRIGR